MEELKQAINALQNKFKDLDAADKDIKKVINSHSKNWDMMQNFRHKLSERVRAIKARLRELKTPIRILMTSVLMSKLRWLSKTLKL